MTIEYDLVIIGASAMGIRIATIAQQWGARVALVEQGEDATHWLWQQTLFDLVRRSESDRWCRGENSELDWHRCLQWAEGVASDAAAQQSLASLMLQGIDAIAGCGKFIDLIPGKFHTGFQVGERFLRSRAYCIALTAQPMPIAPPTLKPYLTASTALRHKPEELTILGDSPEAIALAACLNRVGSRVTLITAAAQILPQCDRQFAQQVQRCLVAQGIELLTQTQIPQIESDAEVFTLKLQTSRGTVLRSTAELLPLSDAGTNLETLNLEALGFRTAAVKADRYLKVQNQGQNQQPRLHRLWLCPAEITDPQRVATLLVQNALFFPKRPIDLMAQPDQIAMQPDGAWVGLSEAAAIARFGKTVMTCVVVDRDRKTQMQDGVPGFYKVVTQRNGKILGASAIGGNAHGIVSLFAIALQQGILMQNLQRTAIVPLSGLETLGAIVNVWQAQRLKQQYWKREWMLDWLIWNRR
jgi:pyruvate/2-oxoglutarate dehydrogenase complex dihydrolipoamide dehydrogenase (E3) component